MEMSKFDMIVIIIVGIVGMFLVTMGLLTPQSIDDFEEDIACVSFENSSAYSMQEVLIFKKISNRSIIDIESEGVVVCRNKTQIIYDKRG